MLLVNSSNKLLLSYSTETFCPKYQSNLEYNSTLKYDETHNIVIHWNNSQQCYCCSWR